MVEVEERGGENKKRKSRVIVSEYTDTVKCRLGLGNRQAKKEGAVGWSAKSRNHPHGQWCQ